MKRVLSVLLCLCIALTFAACGENEDSSNPETSETVASTSNSTVKKAQATSATEPALEIPEFEKFDADGKYIPHNYDSMKIMKLTQWDFSGEGILVSGGSRKIKRAFLISAEKVMKNIAESGYNTVLVQLRPFADSFYKSEYYPLSKFVTGNYFIQTESYDAVEILVYMAHKYNLSVHGWINPMRCMTSDELAQVTGEWDIKKWYSAMGDETSEYRQYMFERTDAGGATRLYLNPAYEETRNLIINGVREICDNYKVDGIFMDDYFYPSTVKNDTSIDSLAYEAREDDASLFDFRCNAISALVRGIYSTIKEANSGLIYGISPNGEINTCYLSECADVHTWCSEEGYVDIMYPQFYYGMLHNASAIDSLAKEWSSALVNEKIKLVPILTVHKVGLEDQWATSRLGKTEWIDHNDVLLETMTYLMSTDDADISGIGFFCYAYFFGGKSTDAIQKEISNFTFLFNAFEEYNGRMLEEFKQLFSENGLDLDAKTSEWNDALAEARGKEIF